MASDGSGVEGGRGMSMLKRLADQMSISSENNQSPKSRFDPDSAAIIATPASDMARSPIRKSVQMPQPIDPQSVEARLGVIQSRDFGYTPGELELAKLNGFDLNTVDGKAAFAIFLGKQTPTPPSGLAKRFDEIAQKRNKTTQENEKPTRELRAVDHTYHPPTRGR